MTDNGFLLPKGRSGRIPAVMHVPADDLTAAARSAIARRLREAVDVAGGPKQVSDVSEVAYSTLLAYLRGGEIKLGNLLSLARACGVSVEWLATGGGRPPSWRAQERAISMGSSEPQEPLLPPRIDVQWLTKAIEIVDSLGGSALPPRERAVRIANAYDLLTAPGDLPPLPQLPPRPR